MFTDENMDDTDDNLTDSTWRVVEKVCRSSQSRLVEPRVSLRIKPREGEEYINVNWLSDSGVYHMFNTEKLYKKLLQVSHKIKLWTNKVKFITYASDKILPVLGRVKFVVKLGLVNEHMATKLDQIGHMKVEEASFKHVV